MHRRGSVEFIVRVAKLVVDDEADALARVLVATTSAEPPVSSCTPADTRWALIKLTVANKLLVMRSVTRSVTRGGREPTGLGVFTTWPPGHPVSHCPKNTPPTHPLWDPR
eukprot:3057483-Prymnesium_polylepis.1